MNPIVVFFLSALFAFLFTGPAIALAKKLSLVTDKSTRAHPAHTHTGLVPRGGGVPIFMSFVLSTILFVPINNIIWGILISSTLLVIMGLADDFFDMSPYVRFLGNIVISFLVVGFGLGIPYISNPLGGIIQLDQWKIMIELFGRHDYLIVGNIIAIIWLTWTTNMVNWSKGVDGQLPGFVSISALFLGILATRFSSHDIQSQTVVMLSFIVAGAYAGFLPYNFYPQRIMPGYGGGGLAGLLLGILAILSFGKIGTAVVILAIPMLDATYTIIRRLRNRQSPFRADWGHFHHRLLEVGWGRRRIAVFYWSISAILGFASLFMEGVEKLIAFVMIGLVLLAFMVFMNHIKSPTKSPKRRGG